MEESTSFAYNRRRKVKNRIQKEGNSKKKELIHSRSHQNYHQIKKILLINNWIYRPVEAIKT